mmetsp:Transcript_128095/g.410571  ORF Transcript_128095/g.410571 Transcript_128095/m.410571 type:complete len:150 (+) Transcript_128095:353-802(+)
MLLFASTSALRDRAQMSDPLPLQLRQDLFVLVLYLACHWPLPGILNWAWHHVLMNPVSGKIAVGSQHRWYLLFAIACRTLHHLVFRPIAARLPPNQLDLPIGLFMATALGFWMASIPPINLCPGGIAADSWSYQVSAPSCRSGSGTCAQ